MAVIPSPSADDIGAGAPADEIEITPAMIEAGVKEFCSYDPDLEQARDIVPEIFKAMLRAWHDPSSVIKPYHHVGGLGTDVGIELAKEIDQVEANYGSE
jgi:hypothetical protein